MNKFITKQGTRLAALAAGVVLFSFTATAQNLYNGATGKINNEGVIRINDDNAIISNDQTNMTLISNADEGVNDLGIHIFGTDVDFTGGNPLTSTSALRIPGFVSYRAGAGTQTIHEGFYDDLDVRDASSKSLTSPLYFVGGDYTVAGGARTYTGSTFTYDGGAATTGATTQAVAAETGAGAYNNLAFGEDALKTLSGVATADGTTDILATTTGGGVVVDGPTGSLTSTGDFTQAASAGDFSLNNGGLAILNGANNTIGSLVAVNDGTLTLGATTTTDVATGGGSLSLTTAAPNTSNLALGGTATLNVDGTFANADLGRTNMTFDATSTVEYQENALGGIITTATSNPYGNLSVARSTPYSANDNSGTEDDLNIATQLNMNGSDLNMLASGGSTDGAVIIQNYSATDVVYAGQEEVIGRFRRTHGFVAGTDYVFGNAGTSMNFATAPTTGTYFEVNMDKDGSTENYDNTRDIDRDVNLAYDNTGWTGSVQVGYVPADDIPGTWTAGYTEDQIRYLEGNATPANERVATGNSYVRNTAGSGTNGFSTVALPGMEYAAADLDGTADAGFFSSNELILRAGPGVVISVNEGRWSNPNTWDSGAEPFPFDSVVVRHNVWAGIHLNRDNYDTDEAYPTEMAAAINIVSPDATYTHPTLMIGSSDITADFRTNLNIADGSEGRLTTGNLNANGAFAEIIPPLTNEIAFADVTQYRGGLIVFGDGTPGQGGNMTIEGEMVNNGCINVGGLLSIGQ